MARAWELWTDYKLRFRANTSRRSRRPCSDTEHALSGRRLPIFCCIRSRRCSVWADSSCSTSIRAPSSTSPRRDIRWYRSTLSANHDQQKAPGRGRPPPAGVGRVADPAGRGEHGGPQEAYGECLRQGDVTQAVRSAVWTGIGLLDRGDSDRGRGWLLRGQAAARGSPPGLRGAGVSAHTGRAAQP
jgi:hypothetical protein